MVNAPPTCACMIPSMVLVVLIVGFVSHTSVWSCHRKRVAMQLMAGTSGLSARDRPVGRGMRRDCRGTSPYPHYGGIVQGV